VSIAPFPEPQTAAGRSPSGVRVRDPAASRSCGRRPCARRRSAVRYRPGIDAKSLGDRCCSSPITNLSPRSRIAARCAPRATRLTSAPARASCTPRYPPIAPAP
jgi:hypothetical protein